jgi:hypothetical protein
MTKRKSAAGRPRLAAAVAAIVIVAELALWRGLHARTVHFRQTAAARETEIASYDRAAAAGGRELADIRTEITDTRARLADAQRALGLVQTGADVPGDSLAAFIDLARFAAESARAAEAAGVIIADAEALGFSEFRTHGPARDRIPAVFHQRRLAALLLEILFQAKPHTLFAIDHPQSGTAGGSSFVPPSASNSDDAAVSTFVRLEFSATTDALARFIDGIVSDERCLLVRAVEAVRPANQPARPSTFRVTVESLHSTAFAPNASATSPVTPRAFFRWQPDGTRPPLFARQVLRVSEPAAADDAAPLPDPESASPEHTLVGDNRRIIRVIGWIGEDTQWRALLARADAPEIHVVAEGGRIAGWQMRVERIEVTRLPHGSVSVHLLDEATGEKHLLRSITKSPPDRPPAS